MSVQYNVIVTGMGQDETLGTFYVVGKAEKEAVKASRKYTSPDVLVIITTNEPRRGFPKCYRMGRLYKP